jgi:hypothetical protein
MNTAKPEILSVDTAARKYADSRDVVSRHLDAYDVELRALRRRHLPGIKQAAGVEAQRKTELTAAIIDARLSFEDPRTLVLHGIKVGFQKGKGRIVFEDDAKVIAAIRRTFAPSTAEKLIAVVEQPIKAALAQLPAHELQRLGVTVEETGDQVVIRPTGTDVDKLVAEILKESTAAETAAAAE